PAPRSPPSWPARPPVWPSCPACTSSPSRATGCTARWTATRWARCWRTWPGPVCAAWPASRPRWRSCSCGTTPTSWAGWPGWPSEATASEHRSEVRARSGASAEPNNRYREATASEHRSEEQLRSGASAEPNDGGAVNGLLGTGPLVRLAIRRDRVLLPAWIAVFVLVAASSAAATLGLFPTVESRVQAASAHNNTTALVALYGRVYDPTSLGSVGMVKMGGLGAVLVAVLAMILVVRHTRGEEESGRLELVGATVVGRYAPLAAALVVTAGANFLLGLLTAAGLILGGLPAAGSLAFGLAWAGVGIAFAAIAAVTAQLAGTARGA